MHWHFNPVCHDSVTKSYGSALATSLNCRPVCLLRQHRLPQSHRTWNPGDVHQPEPVCAIFFPRPSADEKSIRREGRMFEMSSRTKTWHHRHIHMYNKNHIKLNEPDFFLFSGPSGRSLLTWWCCSLSRVTWSLCLTSLNRRWATATMTSVRKSAYLVRRRQKKVVLVQGFSTVSSVI